MRAERNAMSFSRRSFLRGTAGAIIALPFLEAMPQVAEAGVDATKRFILFNRPWGTIPSHWQAECRYRREHGVCAEPIRGRGKPSSGREPRAHREESAQPDFPLHQVDRRTQSRSSRGQPSRVLGRQPRHLWRCGWPFDRHGDCAAHSRQRAPESARGGTRQHQRDVVGYVGCARARDHLMRLAL